MGLTVAGSQIFLRVFIFLENQNVRRDWRKDWMLREINESVWNILRNYTTVCEDKGDRKQNQTGLAGSTLGYTEGVASF